MHTHTHTRFKITLNRISAECLMRKLPACHAHTLCTLLGINLLCCFFLVPFCCSFVLLVLHMVVTTIVLRVFEWHVLCTFEYTFSVKENLQEKCNCRTLMFGLPTIMFLIITVWPERIETVEHCSIKKSLEVFCSTHTHTKSQSTKCSSFYPAPTVMLIVRILPSNDFI